MTMLIVLFAIIAAAAAPPSVCSLVSLPPLRDPAATYLVAVAAADTALAPAGGPPVGLPGLPPVERKPAFGQRMRARELHGPDSARLELIFAQRGERTVLVVPWSYGPACQPIPWSGSTRWAPVDQSAAYRLQLRPEAEWADGIPTFDALRAEIQPYPFGILTPPPTGEGALTPGEFVALYSALPTEEDVRARPRQARRMLEEWRTANPDLAKRFPAAAALHHAQAILDMQR